VVHVEDVEWEAECVASSAAFTCIGEIMGTFGSQVSSIQIFGMRLIANVLFYSSCRSWPRSSSSL
jgi:hypothetical protein